LGGRQPVADGAAKRSRGNGSIQPLKPAVFFGGRQQSILWKKGSDKMEANYPCRRLSPALKKRAGLIL